MATRRVFLYTSRTDGTVPGPQNTGQGKQHAYTKARIDVSMGHTVEMFRTESGVVPRMWVSVGTIKSEACKHVGGNGPELLKNVFDRMFQKFA